MKNKILIGCLLAGMLSATSCSDYLTEDPKGQLTPQTFFTNQQELDMAVYALYSKVTATQNNTNMQIPQWQGDDLTTHPASNKDAYREFDRFNPGDSNKGLEACWTQHYNVIKACNYVLENAAKTPTSEAEINIAIGQAKYWRAYSYFTLVRVFGPLPLVESTEIKYDTPLTNEEGVYAAIVRDLTDCIAVLPTSYSAAPRHAYGADIYATKQASQATLSAVYMAMAGYPLNKGTEYYKLAAAQAKAVIDGNATYKFILEEDYSKVYAPSHNYSMETVLGISYNKLGGWGTEGSQLTACQLTQGSGWNDGFGEINFWKNMPEGARKDGTYSKKILVGNTNKVDAETGNGMLVNWYDLNPKGGKYVAVYHPQFCIFLVGDENVTYDYGADYSDYDYTKPASGKMINGARHRIIRYSEVKLWYAEAQTRGDGAPNATSKAYLQEVRDRAGSTEAMPADADFADAVAREHGWEIAGNWCALVTRRADQLRLNTLKDAFSQRVANSPVLVGQQEGKDVTAKEEIEVSGSWNDKMIYAPYPASDSSLNPNLKR